MARKLTDTGIQDPTFARIWAERRLVGTRKAFDRGDVTQHALISATRLAREHGVDETLIAACVRGLV